LSDILSIRRLLRSPGLLALAAISGACSADTPPRTDDTVSAADITCSAPLRVDTLPAVLSEASGVAASRSHYGTLWVHNDAGSDADLFAIDTLAHLRAAVRINLPSVSGMDFEDIAIAPCGEGKAERADCIYLADIGDNYAQRDFIRVLRFPEPDPAADTLTAEPVIFAMRYPTRSHDAEAIFILPGGRLFVVTKGRNAPVALFAYPGALRADTVTLRHVQDFTPGIVQFPEMVTAAAASADGSRVAIRTYAYLHFYRPGTGDSLISLQPDTIPLAGAGEFQGEGLALTPDGNVFLVGERSLDRTPPPLSRLTCR
jgi:hypothetical protein